MNEAIKLLEEEISFIEDCIDTCKHIDAHAHKVGLKKVLALLRKKPCDWIPVGERLPKAGYCLVLCEEHVYEVKVRVSNDEWEDVKGNTFHKDTPKCNIEHLGSILIGEDNCITHWMPIVLPKPCEKCGGSELDIDEAFCGPIIGDIPPCPDCKPKEPIKACRRCGEKTKVLADGICIDDCTSTEPKPEWMKFNDRVKEQIESRDNNCRSEPVEPKPSDVAEFVKKLRNFTKLYEKEIPRRAEITFLIESADYIKELEYLNTKKKKMLDEQSEEITKRFKQIAELKAKIATFAEWRLGLEKQAKLDNITVRDARAKLEEK